MSFAFKLPLFALAIGLLFGACTGGDKSPIGSPFIVTEARTQFFKYGPAQSFGADFLLPKGQRVVLIQRSLGFVKVMTEDGISGWVAKEDVAPAPPLPRRLAATGGRRGSSDSARLYSGPRRGSNVQSTPGDPLFDMTDLPPPPLPEGADLPKPKFRVNPPKPKP